ncbi:MAG: ABC transporter permease subunit [Elusimicrobiota bacterium]
MISTVLSICKYTLRESLRNKAFFIVIVFGLIILFSSLFFSILGGEQEIRLLTDFGLTAIEFFCFITTVYLGTTIILEEINNKTIYFIVTRPISRGTYIMGRYLGILLTVLIGALAMYGIHIVLLVLKGWKPEYAYFMGYFGLILKLMLILSVATATALLTTSAMTGLVFTLLIWVAGHFSQEMKYLMTKTAEMFPKILMTIGYYCLPNFQYFNYRDNAVLSTMSAGFVFGTLAYALLYTTVCLAITIIIFRRKEF